MFIDIHLRKSTQHSTVVTNDQKEKKENKKVKKEKGEWSEARQPPFQGTRLGAILA